MIASTTGRFDDDADAEDVMMFYTPITANLQSQRDWPAPLTVPWLASWLVDLWRLRMMIRVACQYHFCPI